MHNHMTGCGEHVQNQWYMVGKKCVRQSPNRATTLPFPLFVWNTSPFIPSVTLVLSFVVSTPHRTNFTSVIRQVLPTFHTTYNHHNQFI